MKYVRTFIALTLLWASPALAQWQTQKNSVPIGRGGAVQGFDSVTPGTAGLPFLSTGTASKPAYGKLQNPALAAGAASTIKGSSDGLNVIDAPFPFAVGPTNTAKGTTDGVTTINVAFSAIVQSGINALCTLSPTTCIVIFGHARPEWYGAAPGAPGAAAGSIPNNQSQVQAAITGIGSGVVQFGKGTYGIGNGLIIPNNVTLDGTTVHGTVLLLQPTTPTSAVTFFNGGIVSNCGIKNMSINTADTVLHKNAITMIDVSQCFVDNVMISAYPTGQWTGAGSVGINTQGRELTTINNVQVYADLPIQISQNPNVPNTGEDLDSFTFNDMVLVAPLAAATTHVITVDASVSIFNTRFQGRQNWIGGIDGFRWLDAGGPIASFGLYISGVKDEQPGGAGGYAFNIQPASLYNFTVAGATLGTRKGFFMRRTQNTFLSSIFHSGVGATVFGMDADFSNGSLDFRGCWWIVGTTATLGAFAGTGVVNPTGTSVALPGSGTLSH